MSRSDALAELARLADLALEEGDESAYMAFNQAFEIVTQEA